MGFKEDDPCSIQKSSSQCGIVFKKNVLDKGYILKMARVFL